VGSVKERKVDLRVISATNCNLEQMVQQGKFRRDLFFRLRIISINVPRLHARGADVLLLARHFLAIHGKRYGKPHLYFSDQAEELLLSYTWPGNVRELRNMLEQTVLLAQSDSIAPHQLNVCLSLMDEPMVLRDLQYIEPRPGNGVESMNLPEVERDMVRKMLDKTDWNVTKSARLLGLSRDMLRYRIEKLNLARPEKRPW
jgi:DNA-binding NtrC family response regulator